MVDTRIKNRCENMTAKPFFKWVGGKRQLLKEITPLLPDSFNDYYEPFLGGGAVFYELFNLGRLKNGVYLSDLNTNLIASYKMVQNNSSVLINRFNQLTDDMVNEVANIQSQYSSGTISLELKNEIDSFDSKFKPKDDIIADYVKRKFYQRIRDIDRGDDYEPSELDRALRFLFILKNGFNGVYRENKSGYCNTPFGDGKISYIDENTIAAASEALQVASISNDGFMNIKNRVKKNDFVYFDPPYIPLNTTSSFTGYSSDGFGDDEQVALRDLCEYLDDNGIYFMVSNSNSERVHELYKSFNINEVDAKRQLNCKVDKRGAIKEALVTNYKNSVNTIFSF